MNDLAVIRLSNGGFTVVDADMFDELNRFKWHTSNTKGHVSRSFPMGNGKYGSESMHRRINKTPDGFDTDHIDGCPIYNVRRNLRTATRGQNKANSAKQSTASTSIYKGVTWNKSTKKWQMRMRHNKTAIYGGEFHSEIAAAQKYNELAVHYFGEFARLNVIT